VATINHENMVNVQIHSLLQDVVHGLGYSAFVDVVLDTPVLDTTPDITLVRKANKMPIASVEGEKPRKEGELGEADYFGTFGSNTQVCGEVFEQLHLIRMHSGKDSIGLLSTFNE
jgi:hypothetical protein